jgi:DnaJ like chaperone protein
LLGTAAGHFAVDRQRSRALDDEVDGTQQIAFTIGVIALGAKMAKADGKVTPDEIRAFREVFKVPPEEMANVGRIFDQARRDSQGFEPYARQIAELLAGRRTVLEDLIDGLFHIAKADHFIHPDELAYLREVARIFGFSDNGFARIREAHLGPDEADPYRILGISREASDDQVKKSYRKLMRDHHPDTVIAQGMPREFVEVANHKVAAINDAYDRIARQRGLK